MGIKFHQSHDVQSIQKRCEEKESRRLQRNLQRIQESSMKLQESLNLPRETSPFPQSHDTHVVGQVCGADAIFPPEGRGPLMVDTALNTSDPRAPTICTAINGIDGQGIVLGSAPDSWDNGITRGCASADQWSRTVPIQFETGDMFGWPLENALATTSYISDTYGSPGFGRLPSVSTRGMGDGLARLAAPTLHPNDSATGVSVGEACLLGHGDGPVALVQPSEPTILSSTDTTDDAASFIGPRAQSEATTLVNASSRDPVPPKMEVLIGTHPPQDAAQYTSVPCYPTPSSDDCQIPDKPADGAFGGKKRARNTANGDIDRLRETRDGNDAGSGGLRRSKRHCDGTKINSAEESLASPPADLNGLSTRTAKVPQRRPLTSEENRVPKASISELYQAPSERPKARASPSDYGQPHDPTPGPRKSRAASVESLFVDTRAAQGQACASCGVNRAHLLRLSQNILRWAGPPDSVSLEAALMSGPALSTRDKEAIILRLALGALRDYILAPLCGDESDPARQQGHFPPLLQDPKNSADDDLSGTVRLTPSPASSDLGDGGHASPDTTEDEDSGSENVGTFRQRRRGQRGRWSPREEARLRAYVLEGLSWLAIAEKLDRSESGVQQHWRIMESRARSGVPAQHEEA